MKILFLLFMLAGVLLAASTIGLGQTTEGSASSDERKIRELEATYIDAFNKKDWDTLERLFAETYTVLDENGKVTSATKRSTIEGLKTGDLEYSNAATSALEVSFSGDIAKVKGNLFREARAKSDGSSGTQEGKFFRTWKRTPNGWLIVEYQAILKSIEAYHGIQRPTITSASATEIPASAMFLPPDIILSVFGRGFGGGGATVTVNGKDVSKSITKISNGLITLRGSKGKLNLNTKSTNSITVCNNGKTSTTYVFTQRF